MTPSLARTVPGVGLYFGFLHSLKTSFHLHDRRPSAKETFLLGAASRVAAAGNEENTVVGRRFCQGVTFYSWQSTDQAVATSEGLGFYMGNMVTWVWGGGRGHSLHALSLLPDRADIVACAFTCVVLVVLGLPRKSYLTEPMINRCSG